MKVNPDMKAIDNDIVYFLEEMSASELNLLSKLLDTMEKSFPSKEEILLYVRRGDEGFNSYRVLAETSTEAKLGLEVADDLYIKMTSKERLNNGNGFSAYLHEYTKIKLRRYVKTNEDSNIKLRYIELITDEVMIMMFLYTKRVLLKETIKSILGKEATES